MELPSVEGMELPCVPTKQRACGSTPDNTLATNALYSRRVVLEPTLLWKGGHNRGECVPQLCMAWSLADCFWPPLGKKYYSDEATWRKARIDRFA